MTVTHDRISLNEKPLKISISEKEFRDCFRLEKIVIAVLGELFLEPLKGKAMFIC